VPRPALLGRFLAQPLRERGAERVVLAQRVSNLKSVRAGVEHEAQLSEVAAPAARDTVSASACLHGCDVL
jgi:hypothetical protein